MFCNLICRSHGKNEANYKHEKIKKCLKFDIEWLMPQHF